MGVAATHLIRASTDSLMASELAKSCYQHKLSSISLALSLAELVVIWGAVVLVQLPGQHDMVLIVKVTTTAWLLGGLCSFGFAVAGLVADSDRMVGVIAAAATVVTFFLCGLTMRV